MYLQALKWTVLAAALALPLSASAHRMWLLPSATNVAGDDPWITVDAALSNDLFFPDHVPGNIANVVITTPDGQTAKLENGHTGKYRSVFDVHLTQPGTYRIAMVNRGLSATYELAGEKKFWRGQPQAFATGIPAGAKNVVATATRNRVETFVSNGRPDEAALKPTGSGLELVPVTHVTDLMSGEPATFQLLVDGRPVAGLKVTAIMGAVRYRSAPQELTAQTGADGRFTLTWPQAGMYWLNASAEDALGDGKPATRRRLAYSATFEVLPE